MIKWTAALCVVMMLTGCAHKPDQLIMTKIETRQLHVPEGLLMCMPEPAAAEVWRTQKQVALYLIKISEAGEDCRVKLNGVRELIKNGQQKTSQ